MSVPTPELCEALARVGASTVIGVLDHRSPRSMCLSDVSVDPRRPATYGRHRRAMRFIPSRKDKSGPASTNRSTIQPQAMEERRGGEA